MKYGLMGVILGMLFVPVLAASQELLVSAAASLTNAFKVIGAEFERENPGTKVVLNFSASDVLLRQILEGAPVDVFASADEEAMEKAAKAKAVDQSTRFHFTSNRLVLAIPLKSQRPFLTLNDLRAKEVKRIAISHPATVPVGRYAKAALVQFGVWEALQEKFIFTQNVRQSLDYLARGEVDAGFVYVTDTAVIKDRVKIALEVPTPQVILYPIAVTSASRQARTARSFVNFVLSGAGQKILKQYGFFAP